METSLAVLCSSVSFASRKIYKQKKNQNITTAVSKKKKNTKEKFMPGIFALLLWAILWTDHLLLTKARRWWSTAEEGWEPGESHYLRKCGISAHQSFRFLKPRVTFSYHIHSLLTNEFQSIQTSGNNRLPLENKSCTFGGERSTTQSSS